ncbi:MAG: hypothetical protein WA747_14950 [Steroidobacteraceae bacterium]
MNLSFVKGHCGWDTVTLVLASQVPPELQLEAALKIIDMPVSGGLEVGFMGRGEREGEIRLRIAESTTRNWIAMCGGMSQVIGKALVETGFRDHFSLKQSGPTLRVKLVTDSGVIPLEIEIEDAKARQTTTVMDEYAAFSYKCGVDPLVLDGIRGLQVDRFIIVDIAALEARHPGVDFTRRDPGQHLEIVNALLRTFQRHCGSTHGAVGMLYDDRTDDPGRFRLYPRFFSPDLAAAKIPYEFQCGTGTVAVGVALAHHKQLPFNEQQGRIVFEWGDQRVTPDPYGIRTSQLNLVLHSGRVAKASFSHSVVEILAEGTLHLPQY